MPSLTLPTFSSLKVLRSEFYESLSDLKSAIQASGENVESDDPQQELMEGMRPSSEVRENWAHLVWWSILYVWNFRRLETAALLALLSIPVAGNLYLTVKTLLGHL